MKANHFITRKTARYFTHGNPATASEIWIALHGYGQDAERFSQKFEVLANEKIAVVCPEALNRFYTEGFSGPVGASWMTRTDRLTDISDYVFYLNNLLATLPSNARINILGFSQGAATACRWVADGKVKPVNLVLWAGLVPPDIDLNPGYENLRSCKLILAFSQTDPFRTSEMWELQYKMLRDNNVDWQEFEYEGGHKIPRNELDRLQQMIARDMN